MVRCYKGHPAYKKGHHKPINGNWLTQKDQKMAVKMAVSDTFQQKLILYLNVKYI